MVYWSHMNVFDHILQYLALRIASPDVFERIIPLAIFCPYFFVGLLFTHIFVDLHVCAADELNAEKY